jgi:hypothetical protein
MNVISTALFLMCRRKSRWSAATVKTYYTSAALTRPEVTFINNLFKEAINEFKGDSRKCAQLAYRSIQPRLESICRKLRREGYYEDELDLPKVFNIQWGEEK